MSPGTTWNRTQGVMVATSLDPAEVAARLEAAGVVARLEWYPGTEHLLSVSVLSDDAGGVGTRGPGGVVPGTSVAELAEDLGVVFGADVLMAGVPPASHAVAAEEAAAAERGAGAAPDAGIPGVVEEEDTAHDARTVVVTSMPAHQAPLHANLLGRAVTVAEHGSRRLLVTTGPGRELGVLGWEADAYPVLRLQVDAEDRTALLLPGPDESGDEETEGAAVFSWAMRSRYVTGAGEDDAAALELAQRVLGDDAAAAAFAAAVPGADPVAVATAMRLPGQTGLAAFVAALGLPAAVADVLEGRAEPGDLPGAVTHEPQPLGRAAASSAKLALAASAPGRAVLETPPPPRWLVRGALAGLGAVTAATAAALVARRVRR
ncbi:hypothetical protein [Georgenia sp. AZ-5]|uniref:hypothetical protein n=1 Tax=Georgenia sp. AZ-5 TaxID=3367526 RepID=UPI0037544EFE